MTIKEMYPGILEDAGSIDISQSAEENERRILIYQESRDFGLREELIIDNLRLVFFIINRLKIKLPGTMDRSDCLSFGIIGLIGCIERYNVSKGRFTAYAFPRITGAILDGIEDFSWFRRSDSRIFYAFLRTRSMCEEKWGYPPSENEVAEEMEIYGSKRRRLHTVVQNFLPLSLDERIEVNEEDDFAAPEVDVFAYETADIIQRMISELPVREAAVIYRHYYEKLTLRQIADALGISTTTCARVEQSGLERLKRRIEEEELL